MSIFNKKFYVIIKCNTDNILGVNYECGEFFYYPQNINEIKFFETAKEARIFIDTFPSLMDNHYIDVVCLQLYGI